MPRDDLPDIRAGLLARLEDLAEHLLGAPALRTPRTWRWGSKGSLSVEMGAGKRGAWHDHEAGSGGGPLDLIMAARRCAFADAVAWARAWCGISDEAIDPAEAARRDAARARHQAERARAAEADHDRRRGLAARLAAESVPVAGTVAERYLTVTRGIAAPAAGWPHAVRFHPPSCALLLAATDGAGALRGVQRVLLTPAAVKAAADVVKPSTGVLAGAAVRLPAAGIDSAAVLLAEGPETGLSVWSATGIATWICLGSIARVAPPADQLAVVCRDDDPRGAPAAARLAAAIEAWRAAGHAVAVATPWRGAAADRTDFNDALRAHGPEAVRSRIRRAIAAQEVAHPAEDRAT